MGRFSTPLGVLFFILAVATAPIAAATAKSPNPTVPTTAPAASKTVTPSSDSLTTKKPLDSLPFVCGELPQARQAACKEAMLSARASDSAKAALAKTDSIMVDSTRPPRALLEIDKHNEKKQLSLKEQPEDSKAEPDASEAAERTRSYLGDFFLDIQDGNWDWDGDDWAAVIYVAVGFVVVGAFILYGGQTLYELITNKNEDPVFQEAGLRYSYSGKTWSGGGPPLYRNANLIGGRYAIGLDRGGMGMGLTVEGGYIDLSLRDTDNPARAFEFQGGYAVAGPLIRFGNNRPGSISFEFLNGASDHPSIGWISKSRISVEGRIGRTGLLVGGHVGAVFYDLKFYDGLAQRRGSFNRDLSLVLGLDTGWEF